MAGDPILVFLHGVGTGHQDDAWSTTLNDSLTELGYPTISSANLIAPNYASALHGVDGDDRLPRERIQSLRGGAAKSARRQFERRRAMMETIIGPSDRGSTIMHNEPVTSLMARLKPAVQADNYLTQPKIRAWVLQRILDHLPESGRIVILAHSLGSVVAADIIKRLPPELDVVGLITIGSPLHHRHFHIDNLAERLSEPPANLGWWVNFWNEADPVVVRRGVSHAFPWALDCRLPGQSGMNIIQPHRAITYLSRPKVANTIGIALFGSRSRELVKKPTFVDVPLDTDETIMLLALRFAHLQLRELKDGDTRDRFADALRMVQSETVAQVQQRRRHAHRPMPAAFGELGINLTRPNPRTPLPSLPDDMSQADAVGPLVVVALSNVIEPFEIKVDTKVRQQAMTQLCQQMQLGSDYGIKLLEAVDEARKVLQPKNWARWAAWGLGSAAIVTATGGVALAAAPGVAGAAAVTSALAAFGPGGMLGGLLTAGTLLTGGGVATGIAASSTTAEAAEALAEAHLAAVIFRDRMGIAQDDRLWADLMENKADVARRLGWLSSISDDGAPDVKVLQQKYDILERAVAYVNDHDLLPDGETDRLDT